MSVTDLGEPISRWAAAQQAAWQTELLMQENPRGELCFEDASRDAGVPLDVDVALGEFSRRVSHGGEAERLVAVYALSWLGDRRAISPLLRALPDAERDVRLAA